MGRRVAVAVIAIPAVFGLIYAGGWVLAGGLAIVGVLGTREVYDLAGLRNVRPLRITGYIAAAALPLAAHAAIASPAPWMKGPVAGAAVWIIVVMLAALRWRAPGDGPLAAVGVTIFAPLYASGLPAFLLALREADVAATAAAATWLVFLPLVLTWICDTAAMAAGVGIGGPKVAPVVSPNKTWVGSIAGSVAAIAAGPVYGALVLERMSIHFAVWQLALIGAVVGIFGQLGDVAESLFKREARVKDSGTLLPGHGGILDRLDSLYWVIPLTTVTFWLFGAL